MSSDSEQTDPHLLILQRRYHRRPRKLLAALQVTDSPAAALRYLDQKTKRVGGSGDSGAQLHRAVDQDLQWLSQSRHHLFLHWESDYPQSLRAIHDPPVMLIAAGNREAIKREPRLAVVGSRSASAYGTAQAARISAEVASAGVAIVSGLALGIDSVSHRGALEAGGVTVAVLGTGCDQIYPRRNWRLAGRIQENGLLLSELPLGTRAAPHQFPQRNRIIAGLSEALLVIEAARKSGSLISARLAANEGREVLALPGLVTNRQTHGVHQLIKDGATLIESGEDVLMELGLVNEDVQPFPTSAELSEGQQRLLTALATGPLTLDNLTVDLRLPVEDLSVDLISLEIMGLVVSEGGRFWLV